MQSMSFQSYQKEVKQAFMGGGGGGRKEEKGEARKLWQRQIKFNKLI